MKAEAIATHHTLFCMLIGLFDALLGISAFSLWSIDPRLDSPFSDAAEITSAFSVVSLYVMCWLLRRGAPRLALICELSALAGLIGSMLLPAVA